MKDEEKQTGSQGPEKAVQNFFNGYNCAQSVACAFAESAGLSEREAYCTSAGLGGGVGGMRLTCGAVTAAAMIAGLRFGDYDPNDNDKKSELYAIVASITESFTEKFGSNCCYDLLTKAGVDFSVKPKERTEEYYKSRPCPDFIKYASELIEEMIFSEKTE